MTIVGTVVLDRLNSLPFRFLLPSQGRHFELTGWHDLATFNDASFRYHRNAYKERPRGARNIQYSGDFRIS